MARKIKHNIDIIIQYDTRERDLDYLKTIKIDSRRNKDGIKVTGIEKTTVKPLGCSKSTSDISYKWRYEGEEEWHQSNLGIEIKKGMDLMQSIYTKANRDRLFREIDRCKEAKLDFYFLVTDSIQDLNKKIMKVRKFNENTCKIVFDNLFKLSDYLTECGYNECICTGVELGWVIRRLVKNNVKKYKVNYK